MKVIISAAGTGGHINPGIAIANKIKEKEAFPDILDYAVVEHDLIPITTYEFGLGNHLDYGGS